MSHTYTVTVRDFTRTHNISDLRDDDAAYLLSIFGTPAKVAAAAVVMAYYQANPDRYQDAANSITGARSVIVHVSRPGDTRLYRVTEDADGYETVDHEGVVKVPA